MRTRLLLLLVISTVPPPGTVEANPGAVVRIKSHGASGVVIHSIQGRTWILSCAHMFDRQSDLQRRLKLDGPVQPQAPRVIAQTTLLAYDKRADLSLLYLNNGPFQSVRVAPQALPPGPAHSMGYDEMRWPMTHRMARVLGTSGSTTYTDAKPWHGRSGGALVDQRTGCLIGIVQGYEVRGGGRGLYVSHAAIVRFLQAKAPDLVQGVQIAPQTPQQPNYQISSPIC